MKKYKFKAAIHKGDGGGAFIVFPYDTEKEFGTKGRVAVKATFDGAPYTGSLAKYGMPEHILGIPKAVREQLGKKIGDRVDVVVWKDEEERTVEIPAPFEALLKKERLTPFFSALSFTNRKEYCRWIAEARREETRSARLGKAIELLRKGVKSPFAK